MDNFFSGLLGNALFWAIIGLLIGTCVTKAIENKNNSKKYLYLFLAAAVGIVFIALKTMTKQ